MAFKVDHIANQEIKKKLERKYLEFKALKKTQKRP